MSTHLPAALGNRLWQAATCWEACRYFRSTARLRDTQEKLLSFYVGRQAPTPFGKRHGLRVGMNYEEFRQNVPLSSYDDLQPYLAQPGGLCPEPVTVWEPTGGATGGSKWIPWNTTVQAEFRRAVAVWVWSLFSERPKLRNGRAYWQLTPNAELEPPDWLDQQQTGFQADGDYLGPLGRWLESTVLLGISPGPDLWKRTTQTLREAKDLRMLSCWSPTFLLRLQEECLKHLGGWRPEKWWPHLDTISCWADGPSGPFAPRIKDLFPGVALQPKGLLATEGVTTIPVRGRYPLAYRSHYFEFLGHDNEVFAAWELKKDQAATVLLTTGSGLTRYRTNDTVRVTGFMGSVPCLQFLGREGVVDHRGEKLEWSFLTSVLRQVEGFAMLAFEEDGYLLFVDNSQSAERRREQVQEVEDALLGCYTYADCRHLGQLQALRGYVIAGDAFAQFERHAREVGGQRDGTAKLSPFHSYQGWSRVFQGEFL